MVKVLKKKSKNMNMTTFFSSRNNYNSEGKKERQNGLNRENRTKKGSKRE